MRRDLGFGAVVSFRDGQSANARAEVSADACLDPRAIWLPAGRCTHMPLVAKTPVDTVLVEFAGELLPAHVRNVQIVLYRPKFRRDTAEGRPAVIV